MQHERLFAIAAPGYDCFGEASATTMSVSKILVDAFGRIREGVHEVTEGLGVELLTQRPGPRANTIGWLVWHLTRVQDDHVSKAAAVEQAWIGEGWARRFDLPFDLFATGWGQSHEEVAAVTSDRGLLVGYHDAVHAHTVEFVSGLGEPDLERVVDEAWDPPVTLGVRLVSVVADDLQHVGQASYVRGLLESRA